MTDDTTDDNGTCGHDDCERPAVCLLDMTVLHKPEKACERCAKDELFADPDNTTITEYFDSEGDDDGEFIELVREALGAYDPDAGLTVKEMGTEIGCGILGRAKQLHEDPNDNNAHVASELNAIAWGLLEEFETHDDDFEVPDAEE